MIAMMAYPFYLIFIYKTWGFIFTSKLLDDNVKTMSFMYVFETSNLRTKLIRIYVKRTFLPLTVNMATLCIAIFVLKPIQSKQWLGGVWTKDVRLKHGRDKSIEDT